MLPVPLPNAESVTHDPHVIVVREALVAIWHWEKAE
jgi:hypothetical protein